MTNHTTADQIEETIGVDALLSLSQHFGGLPLNVPEAMHRDHPIALTIGWRSAKALADSFGGRHIDIPTSAARRAKQAHMRRLRAQGMTVVELARQFGYTARHVRRILNG